MKTSLVLNFYFIIMVGSMFGIVIVSTLFTREEFGKRIKMKREFFTI